MRSTSVIAALIATLITGVPDPVRGSQPAPLPSPRQAVVRAAAPTAPKFLAADRADLLRRLNRFAEPGCDLEAELFADAADGRLDAFSPLEAALVASGVTDRGQLQEYVNRALHLARQLQATGIDRLSPQEQVETVFNFLHRHVLYGGYDLAATDLRQVFDSGRFNCVSATVLFNDLALKLGFDCTALEMPGHAMSRVSTPTGPVDVETTCPRWFELMHDPQQQAALVAQTAGTAAAADRSQAREVTPIQIIAMIYYNRAVDFLAEKRFADAAAANAKALRLDPTNKTARGNLLATLNNWSIELVNSRRFAAAVDLLRQGLALDPRFEPFTQNYVHLHRQWSDTLCRAGKHPEALAVLSRAAREMPDCEPLRLLQRDLANRK